MKRLLLSAALLAVCSIGVNAQRVTDKLDRGLVAVKTTNGVLCTWRIQADEYYDVKYNVYRDGTKLNSEPLETSNFTDAGGAENSTYTVTAVVRGKEQAMSKAAKVWTKNYMTIVPKHDPSLTSTYVPNDACCADVDGDGEVEILLKYDNESEIAASYPRNGHNGEYSLFECLKLDGTVLWWVNCGPNMGDFQNNEQNIIGYDWDQDGKAEAVFRAADGTTIHMADGTVYTVGNASVNYRGETGGGANWFMHDGAEYLLYVNGATGKPYQCIEYPLKRLEAGETDLNAAWGDGYGHRSSKYFFGAPYLDGRKASIFLARGIYTRHKMIAYDVKPDTHELLVRWRWDNNTLGPWKGQGYHNYSIADVDWDGRDEIVFGSMVIDDNGKGLSTTGLGHGDSHHVGDFDPYSHGQEVFACNEDQPGNNFRDATTSKLYYRYSAGNDDGRANMGNFIDEYPGAQGVSSRDPNLVGGASHNAISGSSKDGITQNFRIYWDGDLCDETFDYNNGKNSQGAIFKARVGRIALLEGSKTNNDTKGTPCYQGDIFGDWREEVIMRDGQNNIRIYTTNIETPWRNYSLWYDHQYRNAMVWQMCGYNQTPHVSYFIGELEGITKAPAPLTMAGRTEIVNNATIGSESNDKHIIMCETGDMTVTVADGATPYILTVNAPSWVQGTAASESTIREPKIGYTTYTHTLKGGAFAGDMRLVKQGDGRLVLPNVVQTYTGSTDVWAGTLVFDGTLQNSPLWLNRFAQLSTNGGKFMKGIKMDYGSVLSLGSDVAVGKVETNVLELGFGSIVELDLFGEDVVSDVIKVNKLVIEKKNWLNGPQYLTPVIRLNGHNAAGARILTSGMYLIGEIDEIEGSLDNLIVEGLDNLKKVLVYEDGKLYLDVKAYQPGDVTWTGSDSENWDVDNTSNFVKTGTTDDIVFVPGDAVTFDDSAVKTRINIVSNVAPKSVLFNNNTKDYTVMGKGGIVGDASLTKTGEGKLTINNLNSYSGGTVISGGTLVAGAFANEIGTDIGALGGINAPITISDNATLSSFASTTIGQKITVENGGGNIDTPSSVTLTLSKGVAAGTNNDVLTKTGAGTLVMASSNGVKKLVIANGSVQSSESGNIIQTPETVEFLNGTLYDADNIGSYSTSNTNFSVPEGKTGNLYMDSRCNYRGKLTGKGTLNVYAQSVRGELNGNWSAFEGTVTVNTRKTGSYDPDFIWANSYGLPKATLSIPSDKTFNATSYSVTLGNLKGTGTINTTGTLTIGGRNEDINFTGTIVGSPTVVKNGTGNWKVTKAIGTVKKVTVKEGALALPASLTASNKNTNFTGTIETYVDGAEAMLRGQGTVGSVYLVNGGCIEPGYYGSATAPHYGTITSSSLNIDASSFANLYIRTNQGKPNSHSYLTVTGKLTLNGTVRLTVDASYAPTDGDTFTLWTAGSFAGTPTLELPQLTGYEWDTTELLKATGVIRVVASAGVHGISADADVMCDVYTLEGVKVGTFDAVRKDVKTIVKTKLPLKSGAYIIRMNANGKTETIKVVL